MHINPFPILFVAIVVILLGAACNPDGRVGEASLATWGPNKGDVFNDVIFASGILDISAGCVLLVPDNRKTLLLVWPEPTSWNASSQAIEFVSVHGRRTELRDGDQIIAGGWVPREEPQFVSPPDPSCKAEEIGIVTSLRLVTD
jgi:hypothetical protein